ncbi:hypothetical protein BC938DRAFT_470830 [Jimgerdemannia flammicorona]|uniref:Protein BCP1 n=1 Tax=Jimgerdemannia flammicorona TaxID=994334 RepID=A0A433QV66_9FUNG|nr:hypothetical protein BC938DRAFT_470830 [Jimgerdemannia flammicorona]
MSKRKTQDLHEKPPVDMDVDNHPENDHPDDSNDDADDDDDDDLQHLVDVDFEFFDPKPVDFHALKRLLTQLFSADAELFSLSELTDLILSQPLLGSTVKVDGSESDPFALLTVLNMNEHKDKKPIQELRKYLLEKIPKKDTALQSSLSEILSADRPQSRDVGIILSERLVNMPVQIVPPMYKMLMEEIEWAVEDVTWLRGQCVLLDACSCNLVVIVLVLFPERTIRLRMVAPTADDDDDPEPKPKKKRAKMHQSPADPVTFYFHPEDEIIARYSSHAYDFRLTRQDADSAADSRRTFSEFGIAPARRVFVVRADRMAALIEEMDSACAV